MMFCCDDPGGLARAGAEVAMDEALSYKDALLRKRSEILGTGGIKPLQASMENNTRQGYMADRASATTKSISS